MKPSEIQELIKFVAKSGVSEVEIEDKDFKITIKTPPHKRGKGQAVETQTIIHQPQTPIITAPVAQAPVAQAPVAPAPAASESAKKEDAQDDTATNYIEIKSPMIGTFYRRPSPDKPNFVAVGDEVTESSVVCIIEAMKLFNEIEAEVSGKIVKMLVEDGSPVEYDQPLFLVDPS